MKIPQKVCIPTIILSLVLTGYGQEPQDSTNVPPHATGDSPQRWQALAARNVRNHVHEVELLQLKAEGSAEVAKHIDLAGKTLVFMEEHLPHALEHYDALLRGEGGLLYGDEGRFLSQNVDVVETLLRWMLESRLPMTGAPDPDEIDVDRIDFGEKERQQRIDLVKKSIAKLEQNTGETFDPKESPAALTVTNNATWVSKAFDGIDSRIVLLEGYLASVPDNVDISELPTLEDEIKAMFARRITAYESGLNDVEQKASEERAARVAKATATMRKTELEDLLKNMEALFQEKRILDQEKADKVKQEVVIEANQLREQIETKYKRELAAVEERAEQLKKELRERDLELEKVRDEIKALEGKVMIAEKKRELPENTKVLLSILSSPGYWAPAAGVDGNVFSPHGRYEGREPKPHSLKQLAASGALDSSSEGLVKLYLIMATTLDSDRPRYQRQIDFNDHVAQGVTLSPYYKTWDEILTVNDSIKETAKKLKEIQKLINTYGKELVEEGILSP